MSNRNLDADIAERIFGWKHILRGPVAWDGTRDDQNPQWSGVTPEGRGARVPHYSSEIAVAMTIIEHLPELWLVSIIRHVFGDGIKYSVGISLTNEDGYIQCDLGRARHQRSLPEAICLAALQAVEHPHD